MTGQIIGTGASIPMHVITNDDIASTIDTSHQWIVERTGIERRHVIQEETTSSMAIDAAEKAILNAGLKADQIGLILVSTVSTDSLMPCIACQVQDAVGAVNAVCFDLNAACAGFLTAYQTAQCYLMSGITDTALIIGTEGLSKLVDWTDRTTCILFGDGAGAVVLQKRNQKKSISILHSDGSNGNALRCNSRLETKEEKKNYYIQMDGKKVFSFAITKVPEVINELLEKISYTSSEIDYYIMHQANRRIIEVVAKRLNVPVDKFPMNLQEYGNTSSASIPILLDEWNQAGRLKHGDRIILCGFGAGLNWGASYLEWC